MQYSQGTIGRIFALRLETGERLPDAIENFAREHHIRSAMAIYVGGAGAKSRLVVGPEENRGDDIVPIIHTLGGIQEVLGVGTLFPDESGLPKLHMHAATGRQGSATAGCTRAGVEVWLIGEVILIEFTGMTGVRMKDPENGLELLRIADPTTA